MTPCLGEIRAVGFNFAPSGWHLCDGSLLSISDNEALFTLLGTTYGGDGQNTFGLPDLRGRYVMNQGTGVGLSPRVLGQNSGTESVTLTSTQMGNHLHMVNASATAANTHTISGAYLAAPVNTVTTNMTMGIYAPNTITGKAMVAMDPTSVSFVGSSLPHENRMPFVATTYIIALLGMFPSPN